MNECISFNTCTCALNVPNGKLAILDDSTQLIAVFMEYVTYKVVVNYNHIYVQFNEALNVYITNPCNLSITNKISFNEKRAINKDLFICQEEMVRPKIKDFCRAKMAVVQTTNSISQEVFLFFLIFCFTKWNDKDRNTYNKWYYWTS